jgi:predicted phosphodiesterase
MSDIHQEFYSTPVITKEMVKDSECLLLAGDITAGSKSIEYLNELGVPGYRVLGNHEFYRRHWTGALVDHKMMADGKPIQVLEDDTVVHNGVRIIGCTLWTDFLAPMDRPEINITLPDGSETKVGGRYIENQTLWCRQGMSDFYLIKAISAAAWEERHKKSLGYIKAVLGTKHNGPTIVMTHHAPSFRSSHPKYDNSAIKAGFCSMLDYFIEEYQPEIWIHGHCHEYFDYLIGKTRVICNPRGYPGEGRGPFNPNLIVEL